MELIRNDTQIDFVSQSRLFAWVSIAAVLVSIAMMIGIGFNLGIDFAGGTVVEVRLPDAAGEVDEGQIRQIVADLGFEGAKITRLSDPTDASSRRDFGIQVKESREERAELASEIKGALAKGLGVEIEQRRVESIGPRVGVELRNSAALALIVAWGLIMLYVWLRFDVRYAPGAVAALIHDVVITAGVFVLVGLEFNLQVLAALLVVIGYSLNDTIVIYDRIRENLELRGTTHLEDVVNQSVNQTLSRTLLTSLTTLTVVTAMVVLGGPVIRGFAVALLVGVTVGTYSTIYVASALLIFLERRFGEAGGKATA
jgi:preprotein translocase subunit SecF